MFGNEARTFCGSLLAGLTCAWAIALLPGHLHAQEPTASSLSPVKPVSPANQAGFDLFSPEFDHFYPAAMKQWSLRDEQLVRGLREAEGLRRKLLAADPDGVPSLHRICEAVTDFQAASAELLSERRPVGSFDMSATRLTEQLKGQAELAPDSFSAFGGRWFGRWGKDEVNHDWQPTRTFAKPKRYDGSGLQVHGLQYAWISNGFGWNYIVSPTNQAADKPSFPYVLGMVYYFDGGDFETIQGEKAHVGFVDSPTRLVWITEREVFLEEVFPNAAPEETVYAITAIYHDLLSENPTISERATQAVYTRSPSDRPTFFEFRWR